MDTWQSYIEQNGGERVPLHDFCAHGLKGLVRSLLDRLEDPKLNQDSWPIYYALKSDNRDEREEDRQAIYRDIARAFERSKEGMEPEELAKIEGKAWHEVIELKELPRGFIENPALVRGMRTHGLLYQPHPYPVPGDFFNEFYPWDAKFGMDAMLQQGDPDLNKLSRGVVDNLAYQVEHYGTILNGTRSYYLTRSQPPFFTDMALQVYHAAKENDNWREFDPNGRFESPEAWLKSLKPAMDKFHSFWTKEPHLDEETGLSRYKARGGGPSPEVLVNEPGHYDKARAYFANLYTEVREREMAGVHKTGTPEERERLQADRRMLDLCFDHENYMRHKLTEKDPYDAMNDSLKPAYYEGDETMREAGTDPTGRYGYGAVDVINYLPVCLNSLLFKMEKEMEEISKILGKETEASQWSERAGERKAAMDKYLWNAEAGVYMDYNFQIAEERHRGNPDYTELKPLHEYPFAMGMWPLWVGMVDGEKEADKAKSIVDYHLYHLEDPPKEVRPTPHSHGIMVSAEQTGCQWDWPVIFENLVQTTVEALMRYGYDEEAYRIAKNNLEMVNNVYEREGKVFEKYNGIAGDQHTHHYVNQGYSANASSEEGFFLWTCGAVLTLEAHVRTLEKRLGITGDDNDDKGDRSSRPHLYKPSAGERAERLAGGDDKSERSFP